MRTEIKALHHKFESTIIYVTHDQIEAMTMADRIVVMNGGRIEQVGTPLELYDHPANLFVAGFLGSPAMSLIEGTVLRSGQGIAVRLSGGAMVPVATTSAPDGAGVVLGIRPEHYRLDPEGPIRLVIDVVEPTGSESHVYGHVDTSEVRAVFRDRITVSPGETLQLSVEPEKSISSMPAPHGAFREHECEGDAGHHHARPPLGRGWLECGTQACVHDSERSCLCIESTDCRYRNACGGERAHGNALCKSARMRGIRDFKYHLAQALAVGGNYLNPSPLPHVERKEDVLAAVCGNAMMAIEHLRSSLDMEIIGAIADEISMARSVLSYGSGGNSSIMAMELHNRLFRLGLSVIAHSDGQMQRMTASVATPETVVIAFSISGYSPSVVDSVRISRHYGAKTIAITAPGSALAQAAEILLPFSVPEDSNLYKPNSARYAMMAIVDLIAMTTAETIGPSVLEGLRRIKHSLAAVNINDPRLPLGD